MTAQEACKILRNRYSDELKDFKITKCMEFETGFSFQIGADGRLGSTYFVSKASKEVVPFNPLKMPIAEYRAGKVVREFE